MKMHIFIKKELINNKRFVKLGKINFSSNNDLPHEFFEVFPYFKVIEHKYVTEIIITYCDENTVQDICFQENSLMDYETFKKIKKLLKTCRRRYNRIMLEKFEEYILKKFWKGTKTVYF